MTKFIFTFFAASVVAACGGAGQAAGGGAAEAAADADTLVLNCPTPKLTFVLRAKLRASSDPLKAQQGRLEEFEGEFQLTAGQRVRKGRMKGNRNADYAFISGESIEPKDQPRAVDSVSLYVGDRSGRQGNVVWRTGTKESDGASDTISCTGTLLDAPAAH